MQIITEKLYNGEVEVQFTESNHRYTVNGIHIPFSVTSISGIVDKSQALIWWAVGCMRDYLLEEYENGRYSKEVIEEARKAHMRKKQEAADTGSIVHDFCEQYALWKAGKAEKPEIPHEEAAVNGVQAFLNWVQNNDVEFLAVEKLVYSRKFHYVGKFDLLAKAGDMVYLMDYKTSKGFYPMEMGMQTAGYQIAIEEEQPDLKIADRVILHFDKLTGNFTEYYMSQYSSYEDDRAAFLSALRLKQHQAQVSEKEKGLSK